MPGNNWIEWQMAGFEFEDWPVEVQDQWREYSELKRQEKWERDHGYDEMEG